MQNNTDIVEKMETALQLYNELSLFFEDKNDPRLIALGNQLVEALNLDNSQKQQ